ncbi:hypothetical protein GYMLUDRAFT_238247 [Collybiopsis luxurians FD-317 M1]|nr:hypothetical protein GYMLUDRAFT_238247 [Collybiopsis luxurians FD-317 M1]
MRPEHQRQFSAFKIPISQGGLAPDQKKFKKFWFEFRGERLYVERDSSGNGRVNPVTIPFVPGSTLKFEGIDTIETLVAFSKELSEEDLTYVKCLVQKIDEIDGKAISWTKLDAVEEKSVLVRRVQAKARAALRYADENPQRAPNFGRGSAKRPGNAVDRQLQAPKRIVTRSMTAFKKAAEESSITSTGDVTSAFVTSKSTTPPAVSLPSFSSSASPSFVSTSDSMFKSSHVPPSSSFFTACSFDSSSEVLKRKRSQTISADDALNFSSHGELATQSVNIPSSVQPNGVPAKRLKMHADAAQMQVDKENLQQPAKKALTRNQTKSEPKRL